MNPITNILHRSQHKEKLNILTFPTHVRYETGLCKTGHNFYAYHDLARSIKSWDTKNGPVPHNYTLLNNDRKESQIPEDVGFDLVLAQNKLVHLPLAHAMARVMHLPILYLEHFLPFPGWDTLAREQVNKLKADINVYITEYSIKEWEVEVDKNVKIVHHGIDDQLFNADNIEKTNDILTVATDFAARPWAIGTEIFLAVQQQMQNQIRLVGNNPPYSKGAENIEELVKHYAESKIFFNPTIVSPIPTSMLEAMASECAIVTTNTCMIPEVIINGYNGFTFDVKDIGGMVTKLKELQANPEMTTELGKNARKTIQEKFGMDRFVREWNDVLYEAANITYIGQDWRLS